MRRIVAVAVAFPIIACAQAASTAGHPEAKAKPFQAPSSWGLFVSDGSAVQGSWRLEKLDAGSLADAESSRQGHGYAIASADGSTLVEIDYPRNQPPVVHVIDSRSGNERSSFQPPFAAAPTLTPDGSRLFVIDSTGHSWHVFDTTNGQIKGKLENGDDPCCGPYLFWLDPSGGFVYRVLLPGSGYNAKGPVTPELVKYDLEGGREVARLRLDGVQAGIWQSGRTIGSQPVLTSLIPGVALRTDGSEMAVLHANGDQLMTIDTVAMKIRASRQLAKQQKPTSWLSLWPRDAYAKYVEGVQWNLAYSPGGRQLIAAAKESMLDKQGNYSSHSLGVRLIDVDGATETARAADVDVVQFLWAPDSSAIFTISVLSQAGSDLDRTHTILMRLDSSTLAVAARREYNSPRTILLLATQ
jgi:hypothetical protein